MIPCGVHLKEKQFSEKVIGRDVFINLFINDNQINDRHFVQKKKLWKPETKYCSY